MSQNSDYCSRAKTLLGKALKARLILIANGKSKSTVTYDDCMRVKQDVQNFQNAGQYRKYIEDKYELLRRIVPGVHISLLKELEELRYEEA